MPYRHAHYFVGFVLLIILGGFWASYWSAIGEVPFAFHMHAISSSTWLLLLIVQSISIHRRENAFHKQMGLASFALFPFLILGFMMIIDVSANRFASAENEFILHNGPSFGLGMAIAITAYLTLYYQALKTRRNVKLHAGYMLATPLILCALASTMSEHSGVIDLGLEGKMLMTAFATAAVGVLTGSLALALLYSIGAHGIMTLNDFKAVEGDAQMGIRSLPVQLGVHRAAFTACAFMLLSQLAVVGLLYHWGFDKSAWTVLALCVAQLPLMRAFVMDPIQQAIKLSAFGVPLFVSAMMVSAWALRAMQGEAA